MLAPVNASLNDDSRPSSLMVTVALGRIIFSRKSCCNIIGCVAAANNSNEFSFCQNGFVQVIFDSVN
jgi:hypothetical protein